MKTYYQLARIVKGFANHRRIEILDLLETNAGLSVGEIATLLNVNYKTISEHINRLHLSGLITKRYKAREVKHTITALGRSVLRYLRTIK